MDSWLLLAIAHKLLCLPCLGMVGQGPGWGDPAQMAVLPHLTPGSLSLMEELAPTGPGTLHSPFMSHFHYCRDTSCFTIMIENVWNTKLEHYFLTTLTGDDLSNAAVMVEVPLVCAGKAWYPTSAAAPIFWQAEALNQDSQCMWDMACGQLMKPEAVLNRSPQFWGQFPALSVLSCTEHCRSFSRDYKEGRSCWAWQTTSEAFKAEKWRNGKLLPFRDEVEDKLLVLIWSCSLSPSLVSRWLTGQHEQTILWLLSLSRYMLWSSSCLS